MLVLFGREGLFGGGRGRGSLKIISLMLLLS